MKGACCMCGSEQVVFIKHFTIFQNLEFIIVFLDVLHSAALKT